MNIRKSRLNRREARDYLATAYGIDYSTKYLGHITRDGTGPRAIYNGKRALYDVAELDAWARSRLREPEPRHRFSQPTPEQVDAARAQVAEWHEGFVMAEAGEPVPDGLGWDDDDFNPIFTAFRASVGDAAAGEMPLTNAQARALASAEDVQKVADIYGLPLDALIAEATRDGPCTRGDVEGTAYALRLGMKVRQLLGALMHQPEIRSGL